jgi:hypothetical protein
MPKGGEGGAISGSRGSDEVFARALSISQSLGDRVLHGGVLSGFAKSRPAVHGPPCSGDIEGDSAVMSNEIGFSWHVGDFL